jgi:hypothetical protein
MTVNSHRPAPSRVPEEVFARATWRKSTYSGNEGQCVEIARLDVGTWHTSSHSGNEGNCVEVAHGHRIVAVRDSKDPDGPKLAFSAAEWKAFTARVKGHALA